VSPEEREMMYIALSYDPDQALMLAPSDQVEYLVREYGIRATRENATALLVALYSNNYLQLYSGGYTAYLKSELKRAPLVELDWFDFMLLQILKSNQALTNGKTNWEYIRASALVILSGELATTTLHEFEEGIIKDLRKIYNLVGSIGARHYNVESVQLQSHQPVPDFMYSYVEDIVAKFIG